MVKIVNDKTAFDALVAEEKKLMVVDFYADWCGPCQRIAPVLDDMSSTMNDVVFIKVNVDEAEDIAAAYSVEAMPTFKLIKGGRVVETIMGASEERLRAAIARLK